MSRIRTLADILSRDDDEQEVYHTDQSLRNQRAKQGFFTAKAHSFDFLHLIKCWKDIVGPMLAQNTIPLKIKAGQLYVLTKHSVFAQELSFVDQVIIEKIKKDFPSFEKQIEKIRYITGNFSAEEFNRHPNKKAANDLSQKKQPHPFDPIYRQKLLKAQSFFADVEDSEMRELLIKAYLAN
jgi:hypothetical protein